MGFVLLGLVNLVLLEKQVMKREKSGLLKLIDGELRQSKDLVSCKVNDTYLRDKSLKYLQQTRAVCP